MRRLGFLDPGAPVLFAHGVVHFLVGLAPRLDVGIEAAAAEHQVRQQRQVGHEEQRQAPGQRALGGAHGEHGVDRGQYAKGVDGGDQVGEQMGNAEVRRHAGASFAQAVCS